MAEIAPHLLKYDNIEPSLFGKLALTVPASTSIDSTPLADPIDVLFSLKIELLPD
jgi:hypothetical protein